MSRTISCSGKQFYPSLSESIRGKGLSSEWISKGNFRRIFRLRTPDFDSSRYFMASLFYSRSILHTFERRSTLCDVSHHFTFLRRRLSLSLLKDTYIPQYVSSCVRMHAGTCEMCVLAAMNPFRPRARYHITPPTTTWRSRRSREAIRNNTPCIYTLDEKDHAD